MGAARARPASGLAAKFGIIVESARWVTGDFPWECELDREQGHREDNDIRKHRTTLFVWTSVNLCTQRKFVNNGTKTTKFRDIVNNAVELMCNTSFDGIRVPRGFGG